jgi:DNA-directed RNA polymerase specialized sigma24 family protein
MPTNTEQRIEILLALILLNDMKGSSQKEKVLMLNRAGFSNVEIANVMEITAENVATSLYQARQGSGRRRPKK